MRRTAMILTTAAMILIGTDPSQAEAGWIQNLLHPRRACGQVRSCSASSSCTTTATTTATTFQAYTQATNGNQVDTTVFLAWINQQRAANNQGAVSHDANLTTWAEANNAQQAQRGMGHHVMGSARRQNSGIGPATAVWQMWMTSPAHQAAILDPGITTIGIAHSLGYWTFNGR